MERGIYFDGWHHGGHCYHPSLPFRSMKMVEDLERYKATLLVWSVLGGGSISLPYLHNEAFGELDPRLRFYGFMNDSEFIAECNKRGIKTMGIVFEVQGWEFPVVVSEDGKHIRQMNVIRDDTPTEWYGLNEFASGKFDGLFPKSLKDWYPDGIINSDGERVLDLQEEAAARTWRGDPVHAQWVEVVGHSKTCYQTCRNNPVWRDYLKKIMEIQIDAGVAGIQLDEAELPITSMGAGGCFCKDCLKQFRTHLKEQKARGTLNPFFDEIDLDTFDYKQFVLDGGYDHPNDSPLCRDYYEFQMRAVKKHFTELVDHAREYARRTQGREILMSGNFFTCMPVYYPFENTVDLVITEMDHTLFRQPHWYRYISGFSGSKPVIVAENPYGGIIPQLVEQLADGKAYDLYRLFLLEASTYGCNMSVPYGGWMGNTIKTGFWPPEKVTEQVQTFLERNDRLYSKESGAKICVPWSFPSYYWREVTKNSGGDQFTDVGSSILYYQSLEQESEKASRLPFWDVVKYLSEQQAVYDVRPFGDDDLRPDQVSAEDWKQYELIILPECAYLTENQRTELERYVEAGGKLLVFGRTAENAPGWLEEIAELPGVTLCPNPDSRREAMALFGPVFRSLNEQIAQAVLEAGEKKDKIGIHFHKNGDVSSIHLLNYDYDAEADKVLPIRDVTLTARVDGDITAARCCGLDGDIEADITVENGILKAKIPALPLYAVIELL